MEGIDAVAAVLDAHADCGWGHRHERLAAAGMLEGVRRGLAGAEAEVLNAVVRQADGEAGLADSLPHAADVALVLNGLANAGPAQYWSISSRSQSVSFPLVTAQRMSR